ncbi:hypothetical protein H2201_000296 [Coniosporium apollinis]|uniref:Uncharacterized protein n=1 Tax=Coniosporium apollinis TaxID=61459 RepID=A0ABQ9P4B2_9PEZI|nr:hypothetical protein H2201_000296 [Coniosporium apollinis]
MAKKKKAQQSEETGGTNGTLPPPTQIPASPSIASSSTSKSSASKTQAPETPISSLVICRNKHWRYISSFHGPWLQLPPEVLESLAHSNYMSPRPHPIDPAVFYDLVKIRKAVDEATNLAVRATSGLTSAALSNSLNAGNGMMGGAAALGLGYGGGGGNMKLSKERKYRMRELATTKLSHAYHLDEIAASVATMQSASTLEDVAHLVLQRNSNDPEAKYVHFFHEKIPSRMMAQYTPLDPLNEIIAERPNDGSPYRTRALARIFKDDYLGAARDLTEGLAVARMLMAQHRAGKDQLVLASKAREEAERRYGHGNWKDEVKIPEEDQPNSLETQLLFHRAGVYFAIACQHVNAALDGLKEAEKAKRQANGASNGENGEAHEPPPLGAADREAHRKRLEARKTVKTMARRALRDYMGFLAHFDYAPGLPSQIAEEFIRRVADVATGPATSKAPHTRRMLESMNLTNDTSVANDTNANGHASDALVRYSNPKSTEQTSSTWPKFPPPEIYKVSDLFQPNPLPFLPPYPPVISPLPNSHAPPPQASIASALADSHEAITYHPLLTDALHSLLLCHSLLQTPPKELLRHAHNAARLARVCDGYPIFLAARSPARADWIEVLRRAGNWIGVLQSWEVLCRPAPLPGHGSPGSELAAKNGKAAANGNAPKPETEAQKRERQKHEAILEALADERVVDEESFQRAVRARERRNREDEELEARMAAHHPNGRGENGEQLPPQPKRWAQEDGKEYPITTERAEAIARWVREAPLSVEGARKGGRKKGRAGAGGKKARDGLGMDSPLAGSVGELSQLSLEDVGDERLEEEVDE